MRILITGATGFVGSHLVQALASPLESRPARWGGDGSVSATRHRATGNTARPQLRALVRPTSDLSRLRRLGIESVTGDLGTPGSIREAVSGVDVVVHLGALTRARTEAEFHAVNETGTRILLEAAARSGTCSRFIYVSSLAAAGPSRAGKPVTAAQQPAPLTAYGRSKLGGESACAETAGHFPILILRPPAVYGPGDRDLLIFFKLASRGILPVPTGPERRLQLVHAADLADAVVAAALRAKVAGGSRPRIYHVADATAYTWREVLDLISRAVGRRGRRLPVPQTVLRVAGAVNGVVGRHLGRPQVFDGDKARELLAPGWQCETETARRDLGFSAAISLEPGLRSTAAWYREKSWLP